MNVKYPEVVVQLTGNNGNAFVIIGAVTRALKRAGLRQEAAEFASQAMQQPSYDALLVLCMETVECH
jgi:hypothetical protein